MRRRFGIAAAVLVAVTVAAGCSSGADDGANTLRIAYQRTEGFVALDELFQRIKPEFEAAHPGVTVELQPIEASEDDYATRLALSQQSDDTAPDVFYEDTFRVRSDIDAGYLLNLDPFLAAWADWPLFDEAAQAAGRGDDGSVYAVPLGTDTRGIWYSEPVLEAAGVALPWRPATWADILATAAQIRASNPDVVPFHIYAGTPAGEGSIMQGFLPLLYGTDSVLYEEVDRKWVTGSAGFLDSLTFLQSLYADGFASPPGTSLDANYWQTIVGDLFPAQGIGGVVEGSYMPSFWAADGSYPWAEYPDKVGVAAFPTQNGQGDGRISMSGGWTLAVGAGTDDPQLAFDFLALALNRENALAYAISNSQIAVRSDIAQDPDYLASNPFAGFFTDLVSVTRYRPATADYPQISAEIQVAAESVITGRATPQEAAAAYDEALRGLVGDENTVAG